MGEWVVLQGLVISIDDPLREDVSALLRRHLDFAHATTPVEDVHAMEPERLAAPDVTFYAARERGLLLGVGALKELSPEHGEIKSMHTAAEARGRGVGAAMVTHLLDVARERGYARVSLETGSMDAFAAARSLYERAGFVRCDSFPPYSPSPNSTFMTIELSSLPA
jgi:putative acetyltransferase